MKKSFYEKRNFLLGNLFCFIFLSTSVIVTSCDKNEQFNEVFIGHIDPIKTSSPIRYFENDSLFAEEVAKTIEFNLKDLADYETSIGVTSFGRVSEILYYSIIEPIYASNRLADSASFRSTLETYVSLNDSYLELVDYDSVYYFLPRLLNNPFRYVTNTDRICQIGDSTLLKIFNEGNVYTSIENYSALISLNENDLATLNPSIFTFTPVICETYDPGTKGNLGWNVTQASFSNNLKDMLRVSATYFAMRHVGVSPQNAYKYSLTLTIRPYHRTLGCYLIAKRNITSDISVSAYIANVGNITVRDNYKSSSPVWKREKTLKSGYYTVSKPHNHNIKSSYITATSGYAKTAEVRVNFNN